MTFLTERRISLVAGGNVYNFSLDADETKKYLAWDEAHHQKDVCKYFDDGKSPECPVGAIGGRVSFHFTPTGIGTVVTVTCACGAKEDLTNYEHW
jgi:hypothetical protein